MTAPPWLHLCCSSLAETHPLHGHGRLHLGGHRVHPGRHAQPAHAFILLADGILSVHAGTLHILLLKGLEFRERPAGRVLPCSEAKAALSGCPPACPLHNPLQVLSLEATGSFMKTQKGPGCAGQGPQASPQRGLGRALGNTATILASHNHPHPGGDKADCKGTTATAEDGTQTHAGLSGCPSAPGAIVRERSPNPTPAMESSRPLPGETPPGHGDREPPASQGTQS